MRRNTRSAILIVVLLASLSLPSASPAGALPPDPTNAALFYYQALLSMPQGEGDAVEHLAEIARGEMEPDQIRLFLQQSCNAIEFVAAAANLNQCDWGYRFSQGIDTQLPQLSQLRRLGFILAADARLHAFDGNYRQALERCRLLDSLARHVGDDTFVSYLVSLVIRELAMKCVQDFIGQIADEAEGLLELKNELVIAAPLTVSPIKPLKFEIEIMADLFQADQRNRVAEMMEIVPDRDDPPGAQEIAEEANKKTEEFVASLNAATFERVEATYRQRMAAILLTLNTPMPFAEKYPRLKKLCDDFDQDDPAEKIAGAFVANVAKIYAVRIRRDAHANAILAAVDIYLQRAETGKLPATLPADLPEDPFSGKDFQYEQTDKGFVLRCNAKDPTKDIIHEYAFTLK